MASVDLIKVGDFMIKHGVKAVLLVWVASLQYQQNQTNKRYEDCMNGRIIDLQRNPFNGYKPIAILSKEVSVKDVKRKEDV